MAKKEENGLTSAQTVNFFRDPNFFFRVTQISKHGKNLAHTSRTQASFTTKKIRSFSIDKPGSQNAASSPRFLFTPHINWSEVKLHEL